MHTIPKSCPPRILLHPDNCGSGTWRLAEPAMELRRQARAITLIQKSRFLTDKELADLRPDIVVVQRALGDEHVAALQRYRKILPKAFIVFDLDDLLWGIPAHSPAAQVAATPAKVLENAKKISDLCDRIVLSTEALRNHWLHSVSPDKSKTEVVGPYLPDWFFNGVTDGQRRYRSGLARAKLTRIGFAGSVTHTNTLNRFTSIIKATQGYLQWVFLGCKPEGVDDLIEFHPLLEIDKYPEALGGLGLDIAIAPFATSAFDYCKTDLRLAELGALGIPVITDHHDRGPASELNRSIVSAETFLGFVQDSLRGFNADDAVYGNYQKFSMNLNLGKIFGAWLPKDASYKVPPCTEDLSLIPADRKVFGTAPSVLPANCGSVSFLTNDGIYPHPGGFSVVAEAAAGTLPLPDAGVLAPVLHPFAGGVTLRASALSKVGQPDWNRFPNAADALIDWGEWAAEHGFEHCLSASQFVWREKPGPTPVINLDAIAGWYPRMAERCQANQERFEEAQASLCEVVERTFAANRMSGLPEGVFAKMLVNASQDEAQAAVGDGSEPIIFAECLGGALRIIHPPMPNVADFILSDVGSLDSFDEILLQLRVESIDVKRVNEITIDDLQALAHRSDVSFPEAEADLVAFFKART